MKNMLFRMGEICFWLKDWKSQCCFYKHLRLLCSKLTSFVTVSVFSTSSLEAYLNAWMESRSGKRVGTELATQYLQRSDVVLNQRDWVGNRQSQVYTEQPSSSLFVSLPECYPQMWNQSRICQGALLTQVLDY